jgi:transcription-repair coupling factor (superfamily II helicase)
VKTPKIIKEILIVGLTPPLTEKSAFWFTHNKNNIIKNTKTNPFWKKHIIHLNTDQRIIFRDLIDKFTEIGYEKISPSHRLQPGTFQTRGGIIDIFPTNNLKPSRLEFTGNIIETIFALPHTLTEKERVDSIKKLIATREKLLKSFVPESYLVHESHGIGIFKQIEQINQDSMIVIEYATPRPGASPDRLYVPLYQIKKVTPYIGFIEPTIHRLGSELWKIQKNKAREDIIKLAQELLKLYATRSIISRPALPKETAFEKEFEASFEHTETPDQTKVWQDVKNDLEKTKPIDHLIVGDVGFGKTEIALRAAFKIALHNGQIALIAPTTILADQHYQVFKKRLEKFGLNVGLLSRLELAKNQKETSQKIKNGLIDIIIGTHRILSKDVIFKNLKLLIIDEEQRFGVRQKEKLKSIKKDIDILSLSATPIPRTLYLALGNLRTMNVIETPPPGRINVKTYIGPGQKTMVKKALRRETKRNGQIFWLHNKVSALEKIKNELQKINPKLKIVTAHGRMNEKNLRQVMNGFRNKKFNLLVTTTIIENGLDLPNVNTLIVDKAEKLGLGQAYQLRGRIGRSHTQAHAYFFHGKNLNEKAKARLKALEEASEKLGQGFLLAKKDLEIRGAGNLLGREQSGVINRIGLNLYCQMLSDTVENLKNQK